MSMLGDFAFAAVDTFLKTEVTKLIDQWVSDKALNQLIELIPNSGRPVPMPVAGTVHAVITEIKVQYTGTAMRKTQERSITIPDQIRNLTLDRVVPAKPGATAAQAAESAAPVSAKAKLETQIAIDGIGFTGGMGGLSATVNAVSFRLALDLSVNEK